MSKMQNRSEQISIVIFIDALGWEVLRDRQFMEEELPYRRPLRSVFGFSSACVPSILSGRMPAEHEHWSFFYYDKANSPFRPLRWLRFLPASIANRGRVRNVLSRIVKRFYGYTGYFQLYNIPLDHAHLFDYCEKKDLFKPGGLNRGENVFDRLERGNAKYHVSNWRESEAENLLSVRADINKREIDFAFLYMAAMDGLLHQVGKASDEVDAKLAWYEGELRTLLDDARENYEDVRLFICSDHGMATVNTHFDLMKEIEALDLQFGEDYIATYDSTMGRFWFLNAGAKEQIETVLRAQSLGRILGDDELKALGCDFDGQRYGETIFLVDPGVLILPSHMGTSPITGMHGYHPDHEDSNASLLANVPVGDEIQSIPDIFDLMCAEAKV
ncbi:MAG: alkaline phosphatase family protein [Gammaproteobacteria bacterium]|nr:alkaline phosphatase family protein [Gammaproteobacteria bacterium]